MCVCVCVCVLVGPRFGLIIVRVSGSLFECEWAGVEGVIGPKKFSLGLLIIGGVG